MCLCWCWMVGIGMSEVGTPPYRPSSVVDSYRLPLLYYRRSACFFFCFDHLNFYPPCSSNSNHRHLFVFHSCTLYTSTATYWLRLTAFYILHDDYKKSSTLAATAATATKYYHHPFLKMYVSFTKLILFSIGAAHSAIASSSSSSGTTKTDLVNSDADVTSSSNGNGNIGNRLLQDEDTCVCSPRTYTFQFNFVGVCNRISTNGGVQSADCLFK